MSENVAPQTKKRGLAIEMAVLTMVIVSALCLILTVVVSLMRSNSIKDRTDVFAEAEVDSIAEDFITALGNTANFTDGEFNKYAFIGQHGDFVGNIVISSQENETGAVYVITVSHPDRKVSVTVTVRRVRKSADTWSVKTISWKHGS